MNDVEQMNIAAADYLEQNKKEEKETQKLPKNFQDQHEINKENCKQNQWSTRTLL